VAAAARPSVASAATAAGTDEWWTAHADIFADVSTSEAFNALLTASPATQARRQHARGNCRLYACALRRRLRSPLAR
jgi:hypothetical protein